MPPTVAVQSVLEIRGHVARAHCIIVIRALNFREFSLTGSETTSGRIIHVMQLLGDKGAMLAIRRQMQTDSDEASY